MLAAIDSDISLESALKVFERLRSFIGESGVDAFARILQEFVRPRLVE